MKRDLFFSQPLMNAAGILGFAPDSRAPVEWERLGAFVTNPISFRPRLPAAQPIRLEYPGGFLYTPAFRTPDCRRSSTTTGMPGSAPACRSSFT